MHNTWTKLLLTLNDSGATHFCVAPTARKGASYDLTLAALGKKRKKAARGVRFKSGLKHRHTGACCVENEVTKMCIWLPHLFSGMCPSVIIPPASTKLIGGYTGITLSVCPSVDRIVSALYLQQYSSDPFHINTSYQATSEGVSHVMPVSKF